MTEIMRQTDRFDQILVCAEGARERPADLRDFERMRQARPVIIALVVDENLRFIFKPSERCGVDDAVFIALERAAKLMLIFKMLPTFCVF